MTNSTDRFLMSSSLQGVRDQCESSADAIRWACILEATAPKAGNVFPGRRFPDLDYRDFVSAAEITSGAFAKYPTSFSEAVFDAARTVAEQIGSNVNLGILLLIGPLAQADHQIATTPVDSKRWRNEVSIVLARMTSQDARRLYQAINIAAPGGMGQSDQMDLAGPPPSRFLDAMKAASSYDRIARNYVNDFVDLFESIVPTLENSFLEFDDPLTAIERAHLSILAAEPDSLIGRKFGIDVARDVQLRAQFDHSDKTQRSSFDRFLRTGTIDLNGQPNRLNPGTTADLIASGLYVLLRKTRHCPQNVSQCP